MSKKIEEYARTLTVHGLSWIYIENATEKCLWAVFAILALVTNGIVLAGYVTRYEKYEVYEAITQTPTTEANGN